LYFIVPEFDVESVTLSESRECEERATVEAARTKLTERRLVMAQMSGTVALGRLPFITIPHTTSGHSHNGRRSGQVQLTFLASESRFTLARVTAFLAQTLATVEARIRVAQVHLRVANVMFSHSLETKPNQTKQNRS